MKKCKKCGEEKLRMFFYLQDYRWRSNICKRCKKNDVVERKRKRYKESEEFRIQTAIWNSRVKR